MTQQRDEAWGKYDAARPHGDVGSHRAFLAGWDAASALAGWQPIETAPKDRFILLYCPEDGSRWLAKWQGPRWHGVDDLGLTREGASLGDPNVVTGWFVSAWQELPSRPGGTDA